MMDIQNLTYGQSGFVEVKSFLDSHAHAGWTLSVFDICEGSAAEIMPCSCEDMINVLMYVSQVEHDYPAWIGENSLTDSYVVGMNFTRGRIVTPGVYRWSGGKLVNI